MKPGKNIKSRRESGNALVETIVLTGIMVPLFGALPLLGKISDVNNTTVQASRYVAWERTIADDLSTQDITTEVSNRFFAKPDLQIKTNQGALTGSDNQNPFWTGFGKQDDDTPNRLVKAGDGPRVGFDESKAPGMAGTLSSGIVKMGETMSNFSGGKWDLEDRGLFTARIGIDIGSNSRLLSSGKNCEGEETDDALACVRRSNTILVDGWEARDASNAEERARTFVIAGALEDVLGEVVGVLGAIPFFKDLGTLESDENGGFGYVDAEVVPLDRYLEP